MTIIIPFFGKKLFITPRKVLIENKISHRRPESKEYLPVQYLSVVTYANCRFSVKKKESGFFKNSPKLFRSLIDYSRKISDERIRGGEKLLHKSDSFYDVSDHRSDILDDTVTILHNPGHIVVTSGDTDTCHRQRWKWNFGWDQGRFIIDFSYLINQRDIVHKDKMETIGKMHLS